MAGLSFQHLEDHLKALVAENRRDRGKHFAVEAIVHAYGVWCEKAAEARSVLVESPK